MTIDDLRFSSISQVQDQYLKPQGAKNTDPKTAAVSGGDSFAQILNKIRDDADNNTVARDELKFSKHATNRLSDRSIELTKDQMDRLYQGAREAGEKGIKDSLILVDQLAFIVNVPNNTVVTAMDQTETKSNVFTNIDGAVIA